MLSSFQRVAIKLLSLIWAAYSGYLSIWVVHARMRSLGLWLKSKTLGIFDLPQRKCLWGSPFLKPFKLWKVSIFFKLLKMFVDLSLKLALNLKLVQRWMWASHLRYFVQCLLMKPSSPICKKRPLHQVSSSFCFSMIYRSLMYMIVIHFLPLVASLQTFYY